MSRLSTTYLLTCLLVAKWPFRGSWIFHFFVYLKKRYIAYLHESVTAEEYEQAIQIEKDLLDIAEDKLKGRLSRYQKKRGVTYNPDHLELGLEYENISNDEGLWKKALQRCEVNEPLRKRAEKEQVLRQEKAKDRNEKLMVLVEARTNALKKKALIFAAVRKKDIAAELDILSKEIDRLENEINLAREIEKKEALDKL